MAEQSSSLYRQPDPSATADGFIPVTLTNRSTELFTCKQGEEMLGGTVNQRIVWSANQTADQTPDQVIRKENQSVNQ